VAEVELGHVAVLPGLVNAHTHLELSHLRDAIPSGQSFVSWIRRVVALQRERRDPGADSILAGVDEGIREAVASGTALVGDISNTLVSFDPLVRSALAGVVFYELIRFRAASPGEIVAVVQEALDRVAALTSAKVRGSLAAHAPYSVSPDLFRALSGPDSAPFSVHLSESVEETEFVRTGGGPWRTFLEDMGSWDPAFVASAVSPVEYLDRMGVLGPRTLAVHGVQMTPSDLARLAERGSTLVTCPRSNARTGAGTPPIADFYASGVRVAVGTDSLASTPDLNIFSELAAMRALAPSVPAASLLESATRHGAAALGFDHYGTIEPGQHARLLLVTIPPGCDDVEEYLVSGIQPEQCGWLI
jgi:cytosine/adenosine deaminase-related metal-dependent hydrolase